MKSILVATDFSDAASNAISYAAELANATGASLSLLHVYHTPPVVTEVPLVIPPLEEIEKKCLEDLKVTEKKLVLHYEGRVSVNIACRCGFAVDEIIDYAKETNQDLIVMGMQGSGYIAERLIGSIATSVIENTKVPAIVVSKDCKFKKIESIVFACDFVETTAKTIEPLKELAKQFDATLYLLTIAKDNKTETEITSKQVGVDALLQDVKHSFYTVKSEDVIGTINEFAQTKQADLVVMIPHHHNMFEKLLKEPYTKQMAFHTQLPLLAL